MIDQDGENKGIVDTAAAIAMSEAAKLDLVEISPNVEPPVCRMMDYGKFRFEEAKKSQAAKKKQKQIQVKEIKFRPTTDIGDYNVKLRNLTKFLNEGNKAKVTIRFRGREMAHRELGADLLSKIETELAEIATVEQRPKMEGRQMIMIMAPNKGR